MLSLKPFNSPCNLIKLSHEGDETRDRLIKNIKENREDTIRNFITGRDYIEIDRECLCQCGELHGVKRNGKAFPLIAEYFMCKGCSFVDTIWSLRNGIPEYDVELKYGPFSSKKCSINHFSNPVLFADIVDNDYNVDNFTCFVISSLVLENIQEERETSYFPKLLKYYSCGNKKHAIYTVPNIGRLSDLEKDDITDIFSTDTIVRNYLMEICDVINIFKDEEIFHSEPTVEYLAISKGKHPSNIHIGDLTISSRFLLKVLPSKRTSVKLPGNGGRIYSASGISAKRSEKIADKCVYEEEDYFMIRGSYSNLKFSIIEEFFSSKRPDLGNVLDFYGFFYSLLTIPEFNRYVSNKGLMKCLAGELDIERLKDKTFRKKDLYKLFTGMKLLKNAPSILLDSLSGGSKKKSEFDSNLR